MKSRINLYSKAFAPRLEVVSLHSLLVVTGLIVASMILYWVLQQSAVSTLSRQTSELSKSNELLEQQVTQLQTTLTNRQPDPALQAMVTRLQNQLTGQQRLLTELSRRDAIRKQGFAGLLTDLAARHQPGLWLELIEVDEQEMRLHGSVNQAETVPVWLAGLAQAESFQGKSFDTATVYRINEHLRFELDTARVTPAPDAESADIANSLAGATAARLAEGQP